MNYKELSNEELDRLVMQKDGNAICEMADRNRKGSHGVLRNATRAFNLYHKAEKMNMPQAFQALGEMYAQGDYVAQNMDIANEYFEKATRLQSSAEQEYHQDWNQEQKHHQDKESKLKTQYDNDNIEYEEQSTVLVTNEFEDNSTDIKYDDTVVQYDNTVSIVQGQNDSRILDETWKVNSNQKVNMDLNEIKLLLDKGFNSRMNQDYHQAKACATKVLEALANVSVNEPEYEYKIDAFWLTAFTAFNQGNYMLQEQMSAQPGVSDKYPWSVYLLTVVHLNTNQASPVLETDMTKLLYSLNNKRLNQNEHSQLLALIGDLYLRNIHSSDGDTMKLAHSYFSVAANEGNNYAKEQLTKFSKTITGKINYKG